MVYNDLKIQIGNNIAACRKRCGLTQAELAEKLDYSDKAVSKWERGLLSPDILLLPKIARLFQRAHLLQNGSLHLYILIILMAVLALLVFALVS